MADEIIRRNRAIADAIEQREGAVQSRSVRERCAQQRIQRLEAASKRLEAATNGASEAEARIRRLEALGLTRPVAGFLMFTGPGCRPCRRSCDRSAASQMPADRSNGLGDSWPRL